MAESVFQRSFAGGELAPALAARADLAKYLAGLRTCRNFIVQRHGGAANRPGTRFIQEAKGSAAGTFLLRYDAATAGTSLLIEAAPGTLRFYQNGALVTLSGVAAWSGATPYVIGDIVARLGVNYYCILAHTNQQPPNATYWYAMPTNVLELPTPFGAGGFAWSQSANTITMTAYGIQPRELIYVSLTVWIIRPVATAPSIGPPTGLNGTPGPAGTLSYQYVVTAAAADTYEESTPSSIRQLNTVGVPTPASPHVLSWTAPAGGPAAAEYYVYLDPFGNGTFGYIGTATGATSFRDTGFTPDFAVTPPVARTLFASSNNYPAVSGSYQQRRIFANTVTDPDGIFGSRVGFPSNFTIASPLQDDDAITFKIAGAQQNPVRHLVGLKTLVVLTDGGGWTVGQAKTPLTPGNLPADQETYVGASDVRPVVIGNSILYVQSRGSIVRDLRFEQEVEGLAGRDLTIFAAHLFDGYTITDLDYQHTPHSIVWACRSDGTLLGLTYIREQDVWGWHRHDTGAAGQFESVCVVAEADEDVVYVLVRRTIGGVTKRYIERLESRLIQTLSTDAFFVDSGLTYSGAPATTIAGLAHLEGEIVSVVADGVVIFNGDPTAADAANYRVYGGTITAALPASSVIHAGLPIRYAEIELLDLDVQGSSVRDKKKRVGSVALLVEQSARTFWVGPDATRLRQVKLKPNESGAGSLFTGQETISTSADYNDYGRVLIRQVDPLPLTVLGVLPSVELGG